LLDRAALCFSLILFLFGGSFCSLAPGNGLVSLSLALGVAHGFVFLIGSLSAGCGVLSLSLSLPVEFLLAARFFHLSLLLPGFTTGLLPGLDVRFLLFAGGLGLGLAGLLASALLGFQLRLVLCFGFAAFRFDTRALGRSSSFGIDFCLAILFGTNPLSIGLGLALLLLGLAVRFNFLLALKLGGFAPGISFGSRRTRCYCVRDGRRWLGGALKIALGPVGPMRSGYGSFDFTAQFVGGNGAEFAPAGLLNLLGGGAFVDDGVIDHLNVRNVNRIIDNRGVVHDPCRPDRLEKTAFLDKHVIPLGNSTGVYLYDP